MKWRPRSSVRATDRGLIWSAFWSFVSGATACYGSMILTLLLWYQRGWWLWDQAMRDGLSEPPRQLVAQADAEFLPGVTGLAMASIFLTVAAAVTFVVLLSKPICQGRRHAA